MGAAADCTEAVERRDAERGREVAVAAATDGHARDPGHHEFGDRRTSAADADSGIGGRPMPPLTVIVAAGSIGWSDAISDSTRVLLVGRLDPHVDPQPRFGGHDVVGGAGNRRRSA